STAPAIVSTTGPCGAGASSSARGGALAASAMTTAKPASAAAIFPFMTMPRLRAAATRRAGRLGVAEPRPDPPLAEVQQDRQNDQVDHDLEAEPVARLELRHRRPREERGDVAGHSLDRRLGAVGVFDLALVERRRHGDL